MAEAGPRILERESARGQIARDPRVIKIATALPKRQILERAPLVP